MSLQTVSTKLARIAEQSKRNPTMVVTTLAHLMDEDFLGKGPGTFDFLGFTHYWGKTRAGGWTIKRMTQKKRQQRFMKALWEWCKRNRHIRVTEQYQMLCAKLRGHYQYYGVRGNYKMLEVVFEHAERSWKRWLGRRTRNGKISYEVFDNRYRKVFPLPKPRIIHAF